jgi:hypothetical protein
MIDPRTYVEPHKPIWNVTSKNPAGFVLLSGEDLSLFLQLISDRRSLPVHRVGCWACYECPFESTDLPTMGRHIQRAHKATPV